LNWAEDYQSVIELYQSADHPALSPKSGDLPWWVAEEYLFGGFCSTTWNHPPQKPATKTRHKNPPQKPAI
jgi:hypothetical protein